MNKRRSHLSTAGAQILRKSPLSPVTPSNVPAHSPAQGPLRTAVLLRKCADQEGGRGVLPRQYSAAQHRSSNPGALWGSGLLAATSNSETVLKQEPIPGFSATPAARGFLPTTASTPRRRQAAPRPPVVTAASTSPAPPAGPPKRPGLPGPRKSL